MSNLTTKQTFTKEEKIKAIKYLYETWKINKKRKDLLTKLNS